MTMAMGEVSEFRSPRWGYPLHREPAPPVRAYLGAACGPTGREAPFGRNPRSSLPWAPAEAGALRLIVSRKAGAVREFTFFLTPIRSLGGHGYSAFTVGRWHRTGAPTPPRDVRPDGTLSNPAKGFIVYPDLGSADAAVLRSLQRIQSLGRAKRDAAAGRIPRAVAFGRAPSRRAAPPLSPRRPLYLTDGGTRFRPVGHEARLGLIDRAMTRGRYLGTRTLPTPTRTTVHLWEAAPGQYVAQTAVGRAPRRGPSAHVRGVPYGHPTDFRFHSRVPMEFSGSSAWAGRSPAYGGAR